MAGLKTPAAKSPATPSKHRKALILEVLVGWLVGSWGVSCPSRRLCWNLVGRRRVGSVFLTIGGSSGVMFELGGGCPGSCLAPCGRHLGAGGVDEALGVAELVGCHLLGRRLAEKGPQKAWRAQTVFTHISNGF